MSFGGNFDPTLPAAAARDVTRGLEGRTFRSVRGYGIASIVLALLWAFGVASVAAIFVGIFAISLRGRATVWPLPGVRLAFTGILLGVAGLVLAAMTLR